jgi:two-component system sporulation sensor kinase B
LIGTEELLINIMFLLIPVFIYQTYLMDRVQTNSTVRHKPSIAFFGMISIMLCMSFPFSNLPGYYFDLRYVPLTLGAIYGGPRVAFTLLVTALAFRTQMGGGDLAIAYTNIILCTLLAVLFSSRFDYLTKWKKANYTGFVLLVNVSFGVVFIGISSPDILQEISGFMILFALVNFGSAWSLVILIEQMRENHAYRQELLRSEKLHVVSELAASVAHEIRNPLTVSRGFMQLMQTDHMDPSKKSFYIEMSVKEIDRAQRIIDDFLSFAKPQFERLEPVELQKAIEYVGGVLTPYASFQDVVMDVQVPSEYIIYANSARFSQLMMNVMKNGIESMNEGGRLKVSVSKDGDQALISIEDNGVGMDSKEIARLGTPFYTTKEKGTGLGLMVCYRLVESLNGKITINSQKGVGTRFCIYLPLYQTENLLDESK